MSEVFLGVLATGVGVLLGGTLDFWKEAVGRRWTKRRDIRTLLQDTVAAIHVFEIERSGLETLDEALKAAVDNPDFPKPAWDEMLGSFRSSIDTQFNAHRDLSAVEARWATEPKEVRDAVAAARRGAVTTDPQERGQGYEAMIDLVVRTYRL